MRAVRDAEREFSPNSLGSKSSEGAGGLETRRHRIKQVVGPASYTKGVRRPAWQSKPSPHGPYCPEPGDAEERRAGPIRGGSSTTTSRPPSRRSSSPSASSASASRRSSDTSSSRPASRTPSEGHDKGGVESRGKTIRLQHLTPIPDGASQEELSARLLKAIQRQQEPKAAHLAEDRVASLPLPAADFDPRKREPARVNRRCMLRLEKGTYSVPSHWKCLDVTADVGVNEVEIVCGSERIVRPRAALKGTEIRYKDFLPDLAKKPQALRQVAPELVEELGAPYGQLWDLLSETHGALDAARTVARILSAITKHGEDPIRAALVAALETDRVHLLDVPIFAAWIPTHSEVAWSTAMKTVTQSSLRV